MRGVDFYERNNGKYKRENFRLKTKTKKPGSWGGWTKTRVRP
jgi:hypothetical protein